jgi:hypothetical protein
VHLRRRNPHSRTEHDPLRVFWNLVPEPRLDLGINPSQFDLDRVVPRIPSQADPRVTWGAYRVQFTQPAEQPRPWVADSYDLGVIGRFALGQ